jgi:exodeoxyribonuclease-5
MTLLLSADQERALKAVRAWHASIHRPIFKIGGLAGVGKTTLLGVYAQELAESKTLVAYATFTGRASSILQRKLKAAGVETTTKSRPARAEMANSKYHDASLPKSSGPAFIGTLHRLLYQPVIDEQTEELKGWRKRTTLDREYSLIVIDEASMIGDSMLADLQAHNISILAVGDHGQLPPVQDSGSLMEEPDVKLEKIHRQAKGNPIIQLAHTVRKYGFLDEDFADGKHVVFADKRNARRVIQKAYAEATNPLDVGMLCWMNRTRIQLNAEARAALGYRDEPKKGELVICLKNDPPIYNGMRGVLATKAEPDAMHPWLLYAPVGFPEEGLDPTPITMCGATFNRERPFDTIEDIQDAGIPVTRFSEAGAPYDFGYALTTHKAQGSEFDHAIFYLDRKLKRDDEESRRFFYTAITRAATKLTVLT